MSDIRQLRAKVRRDLHQLAKVPVFYISPYSLTGPRFIQVRLHDQKRGPVGRLNNNREYAEQLDVRPRIVMMREDLPFPRTRGIFSFALGEAYKVERVEPPDGTTVTAICSLLSRSQSEQYPYPLPEDEEEPTDPGDPDPGQGSGTNLYFPVLTPSASKEVIHNLGRIPNVIILDPEENEVFAEIKHDSKNKFTVIFNPLFVGEIVVN